MGQRVICVNKSNVACYQMQGIIIRSVGDNNDCWAVEFDNRVVKALYTCELAHARGPGPNFSAARPEVDRDPPWRVGRCRPWSRSRVRPTAAKSKPKSLTSASAQARAVLTPSKAAQPSARSFPDRKKRGS